MQDIIQPQNSNWPLWRKIIFRFFFIYLLLFFAPWQWLAIIPGVSFLLKFYWGCIDWAVIKTNAIFFQVFNVKNVHPVNNGSGDTSFDWAMVCFYLSVAVIGCIVWSIIDRKRKHYRNLNYLLCLIMRNTLALIAFGYGFQKLFVLQMPFPFISYLATPLGDFLPMRLSWLFLGYSAPYQIFSGIMEILVGVLLLFRRTATLGVLVATAVFINVMMLNLSYDIPVKLYAMHLVLLCLYLLANEYERIACFFVFNKTAALCNVYHYDFKVKWLRITRIILKLFVFFLVAKGLYDSWDRFKKFNERGEIKPITSGVYDVTKYAVNKDTLAPLITDTLRWHDVIFEKGGMGSVKTNDTIFRRRYGRGYFVFTADTVKQVINFKKFQQDSTSILVLHYQLPDSNTIQLSGKNQNDSLYVELKKSTRHFPLAQKQFHWLSEANR